MLSKRLVYVTANRDIEVYSDKGEIAIYNTVTSKGGSVTVMNGEEAIYVGGAVNASGNVMLNSQKGLLDIESAVVSAAGNITAKAKDKLTIGADVTAQKDVTLQSTKADVEVNDAVTSNAGNVNVTADTSLTIGADVTAQKDVTLQSREADVEVNDVVVSKAGNIAVMADTYLIIDAGVIANQGDVKATTRDGAILISGDITVGNKKDVLLEADQGDIYVGTYINEASSMVSANGSIGAKTGTAGKVTVKTGSGVIDILKTVTY